MENETHTSKISSLRQRTHDGVDRVMDKAESMRESGMEDLAYLKDKATKMRENVDGCIRRNPEKSVLIAAGIGAIVGGLFVATMMRRRN